MSEPRLGLALSSGSARGWAHIGVLQALAARGLRPQVITGASVGALVGAAAAAGRLDDLEHWVRTLTQRDVWRLVDTVFRGGGVMTGNRLMEAIAAHIGDRPIESLPVRFGAVATDLYTGEGGVVNPVPVSLCRALGAELVIAVDLSRPVTRAAMRASERLAGAQAERTAATAPDAAADEERPAEASAEGTAILRKWSGLVDGLVESFRSKRTEPGLVEVMTSAVNIMQDRITRSRLALDPADLLIRPDLGDFQLMDFHRAPEAIAIGRAQVERMAPALEALAELRPRRGTAA